MHVRVIVGLLAATAAAPLARDVQESGPPRRTAEPVALMNGQVLDVRAGTITPNATIVIRDGRIASVGGASVPESVRRLDLGGRYVVPGLMDAHTHIDSGDQARRALESGVTTVRSASVGSFRDVALGRLVELGVLPGPDVVGAGIFVQPRLGVDEALAAPAELASLLEGVERPDALRQLVRVNIERGARVIKTRGTERAGLPDTDPRKQVYTDEDLRVIVEEAGRHGVPVECHAHGDEGARAAVTAGVRSIEHGTYLSRATLSLMRGKGTFFVPTYSTVVDLVEPGGDYDDPALQVRGRHMLPRLRRAVQMAHELGVKVVAGGDTSYGPGSVTRIAHEVAAFVEMGFTPIDAIRSATLLAAELLGVDGSTGVLEPGFEADLIVVDEDPLANVVVLQDPLLVVSNGWIAVDRLAFGASAGADPLP